MKLGIIGCGAISDACFDAGAKFPILELAACADLDPARARAKATQWGVPKACSVAELLADPAIELVVNLTVPQAHGEIARRALDAGKRTYAEKPFAVAREEAAGILDLAAAKGLRVGCAPDTRLCAQVQSARALIDGGAIGRPVAVHGVQIMGGHETWHPNPEFYYLAGGGPMLDDRAAGQQLRRAHRLHGAVHRDHRRDRLDPAAPRRGEAAAGQRPRRSRPVARIRPDPSLSAAPARRGRAHRLLARLQRLARLLSCADPARRRARGRLPTAARTRAGGRVLPPSR
jgi:hypothetical protein